MFWMMRAMGEMLYHDPDQHTFINFITKYIGKEWGYFAGWSYWVSVIFLGMAEITAIAKICSVLVSILACLDNSDCFFFNIRIC